MRNECDPLRSTDNQAVAVCVCDVLSLHCLRDASVPCKSHMQAASCEPEVSFSIVLDSVGLSTLSGHIYWLQWVLLGVRLTGQKVLSG